MSITIYVEGGGDNSSLRAKCRKGFTEFIKRAGFQGRMPRIMACGSRDDAYDKFKTAHENDKSCMLLVDAEDSIEAGDKPWQHLNKRDGWPTPSNATEEQCHMMVLIMESWFLADKEALQKYYGQDFRADAIPQYNNVEIVPKDDVLDKLRRATRNNKTKGSYSKGSHSFNILATLNPDKIKQASPYAKRFFEQLDQQTRSNNEN